MIDIGIIARGRRILDQPVSKAVHRLLLAAHERQGEPSIDLVYVIPGEPGKVDFDGFDLTWRNDGRCRPIVFIDGPSDVAEITAREPLSTAVPKLHHVRVAATLSPKGERGVETKPLPDRAEPARA